MPSVGEAVTLIPARFRLRTITIVIAALAVVLCGAVRILGSLPRIRAVRFEIARSALQIVLHLDSTGSIAPTGGPVLTSRLVFEVPNGTIAIIAAVILGLLALMTLHRRWRCRRSLIGN